MTIKKQDAKGILATIRGLFSTSEPAPQPGQFAGATANYNVQDAAPVFVDISDDNIPGIEQGDNVYADAAETIPYPDGTYTVAGTGFSFTVVAGVVSLVTDATGAGPGQPVTAAPAPTPGAPAMGAPAPQPAPAPAPQAAPQMAPQYPRFEAALPASFSAFSTQFSSDKPEDRMPTAEEVYEFLLTGVSKFASGTTEDKVANLEVMVKAMMQYCFGYELQRIDQQNAIATYKTTIDTMQLASQKQADELKQYKEGSEKLLGLFEQFLDLPSDNPKGLSEKDKARFAKEDSLDKKAERIAAQLKENRQNKK